MVNSKVSIIVLNWNNYRDTRDCMESLEKISYKNYEIIVVDNGSIDGSTQKIQKEFSSHTYIYNKRNLGFTGGINIGLEYAFKNGADYLFFINNDMIVDKDFLQPLLNIMQDERIGLVGPLTYCYPEKEKVYTCGRKINFWRGSTSEGALPDEAKEVECLGGCFLIKREVAEKIRFFYEPYFLIFEETDYCIRAKTAGYKIFCQPQSLIWHKVRQTLDKSPISSNYYFYRNKFLFISRNAPIYIKYPFLFYFSFFLLLKYFLAKLKGQKKIAKSFLLALADFWMKRFGEQKYSL